MKVDQVSRYTQVGIALAAYQPDPEIFAQQLKSIQDQTWTQWICAITLDSPLAPLKKSDALAPFFADPRFVWFKNPVRLGHRANFGKALEVLLAQEPTSQKFMDAIAFSDQDDIWYPQKLATLIQELSKHPAFSLVHCDMHTLEPSGLCEQSVWKTETRGIQFSQLQHLLLRNVVTGCTTLFDADLARKYPKIPPETEYHDHWFALLASAQGGVFAVPQALVAYRQHQTNVVGVSRFDGLFHVSSFENLKIWREKCKKGWQKTFRLLTALEREGIHLKGWKRLVFQSHDYGLGLLLLGLGKIFSDRPLARAYLIRGVGKGL
ncbi:hypothetical protein WDW37_17255 [Bdellovibrionota bacterium FG-1]